ncbi:M23 family metallopeptidase [Mesorhizobium sp. SB112]|uniref:M23 family metallopeptidase n=1 Tax=Mesorhizobium sp. SB112 TaxID=3151853 RepID=UPI003267C31B
MAYRVQATHFGRRKEPHTVIIARGDEIRHFTIRPWLAALIGSALCAVAIGYLLATSYLVMRDDLIGASTARQARIQQAYEDRISALRAQVDRITSRQLLDQQLVESKVTELLTRQTELNERHGRLAPMLPATAATGNLPGNAPVPAQKPEIRASIDGETTPGYAKAAGLLAFRPARPAFEDETPADRADLMFIAINKSLRTIEKEQLSSINSLAENAYQTADAISEALESAGLPIDTEDSDNAVGGPLIALDKATVFDARVKELDEALTKLETMKEKARLLPISNPAPGHPVSSTFGVRKDPLLGTPALHSGMDFRATPGTPVKATAKGKVVRAGWAGGYGRMVEILHDGGYSTRYAHMSKVLAQKGQNVQPGDIIGEVGSTGRSTGPHLHYEVRNQGAATDPLRFLKLGKAIGPYL